MLGKLKKLLSGHERNESTASSLQLAAAVLLIEVAKADFSLADEEKSRLLDLIQTGFNLRDDEVADLQRLALDAAESSASLHRYIETINRGYSAQQKVSLVSMMWKVAIADGEIHHYEEHLIRRIADLLYVPHKDFIRTKHQALREN